MTKIQLGATTPRSISNKPQIDDPDRNYDTAVLLRIKAVAAPLRWKTTAAGAVLRRKDAAMAAEDVGDRRSS